MSGETRTAERMEVKIGESCARRIGVHGGASRSSLDKSAWMPSDAPRPTPRLRAARAWLASALARLSGPLVDLTALVLFVMGFARLLEALLGPGLASIVPLACGLAPCALACLLSAWTPRAAAPGMLACLVAQGVVMAWRHEELASELATLGQAAGSGSLPLDAAPLACALSLALIGTLAAFVTVTCRASWVMALAVVPLVLLGPQAMRPAGASTLCMLALYFTLVLAADRVARRGGRPAAPALVCGCICALALAGGLGLAGRFASEMAAPIRNLAQMAQDWATELQARTGDADMQIGPSLEGSLARSLAGDARVALKRDMPSEASPDTMDASRANRPEASGSAADAAHDAQEEALSGAAGQVATSGTLRRDALGDDPDFTYDTTLDHEPEGVVYLSQFTGQDFDAEQNSWEPATSDDPTAFLAVDGQALPQLSQLVADNPQASAEQAEAFALTTLAAQVAYTTDLAPIPDGVSVPEYVLFTGHEGYCQHFATLATLMLRLYGTPARYVAGYAAPASAFALREDGLWHATLDASSAHAWAEVWDASAGTWRTLETTPPGSAAALGAGDADGRATSGDALGSAGGQGAATEGLSAEHADEGPIVEDASAKALYGETATSASGGMTNDATQTGAPSVGDKGAAIQKVDAASSAEQPATSGGGDAGALASRSGMATDAVQAGATGNNEGGARSSASGTTHTSGVNGRDEASGDTTTASDATPAGGGDAATSQPDASSDNAAAPNPHSSHGMLLAVIIALACVLAGALVALALRARRARILARRAQAPAHDLLADALDALARAGVRVDGSPIDEDFSARLARAVSGLAPEDAAHLASAALRATFGPDATPAPADARCHAAHDVCVTHARTKLGPVRRLALSLTRGW